MLGAIRYKQCSMISSKMFTRHLSLFYIVISFSCCNGELSTINIIIVTLLTSLHFVAAQSIEFVEHPLPLLIPVNEVGAFSCRARCSPRPCLGFWVINNLHSQDMHQRSQLEQKGFAFTIVQQVMNEYKLTLTVNASEASNNSMIACEYSMTGINSLPTQSMAAELLAISSKLLK